MSELKFVGLRFEDGRLVEVNGVRKDSGFTGTITVTTFEDTAAAAPEAEVAAPIAPVEPAPEIEVAAPAEKPVEEPAPAAE